MSSEIIDDPRPISWIEGDVPDYIVAAVGRDDITKIDTYEENGEMAPVVWFRVWCGNVVRKRIRGGSVAVIEYAKGESDAEA